MYYLDFRDFAPDRATLRRVHLAMGRIYSQAPYGSDCTAEVTEIHVEGEPRTVQVRIHVEASDTEFEAIATGRDLEAMIHDAEDQIHHQLRDWRQHRFDHDVDRDQMGFAA